MVFLQGIQRKLLKFVKKNIKIIEDTSESLGAKIKNKIVGTFGDINVTSIRSEKMIGVGEGAVISSSNKGIFENISLLASRAAPLEDQVTHIGKNIM